MKYVTSFFLFGVALFNAWDGSKVIRSEKEWRSILGDERFRIMRQKGTEAAFVGKYVYPTNGPLIYTCSACALPLFHTKDQYDAGSGFPCFKQPIASKHLYYEKENTCPIKRYEVLCRRCDSHLGHLFHDGPPPKNLRYCINSMALEISF